MAKLKVYLWGDNTGVGWYRIHSPARWIKKLGLAEVKTSDFRWTEENDKITFPSMDELVEIGKWADLIVFQRHDFPQHIATFCGLAEEFNIPVVLETDDNIEAVRPYNPGYSGYHPGSDALMWGKDVVKRVDAITVTTKNLEELHKKNCPTYVLPNSLDVEWRSSFEKKVWPDGEVHIGWLGSSAHYENLKLIEEPVIEILKKYPHVHFHTMDMYRMALWKDLSEDLKKRVHTIPWATLKHWPKTIADQGLDIGLAPAVDNLFNRAKSNLRYLEYSMCKTAVIASPTECYSCIKDGKTGLYALEAIDWFNAMEKLILDEGLRKKLAEAAYQDVTKNYDIKNNAKLWVKAYKTIVKDFHAQHGPKKMLY